MMDDYTAGEVVGFLATPLLLMTPWPLAIVWVVLGVWVMGMYDMIGMPSLRRRRRT